MNQGNKDKSYIKVNKYPVVLFIGQVICSLAFKPHDNVIDSASMKNKYYQQECSADQNLSC